MDKRHSQNRLYRSDSSRLMASQPSPLFAGLLAFHMAKRYRISNIENTTNLKKAAVAKALNRDSGEEENKQLKPKRNPRKSLTIIACHRIANLKAVKE